MKARHKSLPESFHYVHYGTEELISWEKGTGENTKQLGRKQNETILKEGQKNEQCPKLQHGKGQNCKSHIHKTQGHCDCGRLKLQKKTEIILSFPPAPLVYIIKLTSFHS